MPFNEIAAADILSIIANSFAMSTLQLQTIDKIIPHSQSENQLSNPSEIEISHVNEIAAAKILFANKEKERRRAGNKRFRDKKKLLECETMAQRRKRLSLEKSTAGIPPPVNVQFEPLLAHGINRITKFNVLIVSMNTGKSFVGYHHVLRMINLSSSFYLLIHVTLMLFIVQNLTFPMQDMACLLPVTCQKVYLFQSI